MFKYVIKRILWLIPVLLAVTFIIYYLMDLAPGDFVSATVDTREMSEEQVEALRERYGLNDSILVRYFRYLKDLCRGDMGDSFVYKQPVIEVYMSRFPATARMAFAGTFVAAIIAIPMGIIAAKHHRTWIDGGCTAFSLIGVSMPNFWVGLLLIILFSLKLGWLPSNGAEGFKSIILPAITVGTGSCGTLARMTRSSMLDVIRQDYLLTARAKGVREKNVIRKHAMKNALIPILTILGTQLGECFGGAVLTETVFAWPGVGRLMVKAINDRDTPLATGCLVLTTFVFTLSVLLVDIAYAFIDPRIKAQYSK